MLVVAATCICAVQGGTGDPVLDSTDPRLGVKGQYLFHLAKGNDWPEEAKSGPFVVAIHNKPDLVEEMASKYGSHPIGAQSLRIIGIEEPEQANQPQVLYTEAEGKDLSALLQAVAKTPTLVVTGEQSNMPDGSAVNLVVHEGSLRYEMNVQEAQRHGVLVGNRIASWAIRR